MLLRQPYGCVIQSQTKAKLHQHIASLLANLPPETG